MNKSKLETQAEKICVYNDQIHRDCFVNGYVTGALKREQKIADLKANFDYFLEGKDLEIKELKDRLAEEVELHLHAEEYIKSLEQQIEKMKRHFNCKHRDSEGYCEVKRTYLIDLSYDGCDKWELED